MAIEVEAKMRLINLPELQAALARHGAKRGPTLAEVNTFFDTPNGQLKTSDQGLRIRVEQEINGEHQITTITHKGPRAHGKLKSRMETEVRVLDPVAAAELLRALGYVRVLAFEKRRSRWLLDKCHVDIDTLPYLGDFVEIEGPSDSQVLAVREKLGLGAQPMIRASYIAMLMTYLTDHGIHNSNIRFDEIEKASA